MPFFDPMGYSVFKAPSTSSFVSRLASTGISVASSRMLLLAEYASTASRMSLGSTCRILSLLITIIGDILSSSAMRSLSLPLPFLSVLTL